MSLRKALLIPLLVSLGVVLAFSGQILHSLKVLSEAVQVSSSFLSMLMLAALLQLAGHVVRAYKTRYILSPVKASSTRFQFRALTLGYLCNTVFPLRLGELVRSYIMASADKISWGLTLSLVLFERAIDALLLLIFVSVLVLFGWIDPTKIIAVLMALGVFSGGVLIFTIALVYEWPPLIRCIQRTAELFNSRVKQAVRFKAWSVIYGLQQVMRRQSIGRYVALSCLSWVFYAGSMVLVVLQFNAITINTKNLSIGAASPYYGVAVPSVGPASLGSYSKQANDINAALPLSENERTAFDLTAWFVVVAPTAFVAVILLLIKTKEPLWRQLPKSSARSALLDKLAREEDISKEMEEFLENYFAGNTLSRIVHRLEREGEFSLLKYFKGGSDAITILVSDKQGNVFVKKIIALSYKDRLKAQYEWLKRHAHKNIVKVDSEKTGSDYYAIDIAYDENDEMFFDYLHHASPEDTQQVMIAVWKCLSHTLYQHTETVTDYVALDEYVNKHVWGCFEKAALAHAELKMAVVPRTIRINGKRYDNLSTIMKKIMAHPQARKDLATYAKGTEVDGDIAVDNILVSKKTRQVRIIDPAPDGNIFTGPVFDFGKNMQSLYCGYEFLFRSNEAVVLGENGEINFQDQRSQQYVQLCDFVRRELAPQYLSTGEQKAIIFHAAALHIRRLKHQVYQNPSVALAMYAVGVRTFNDFLKQYK
jgi:hypothetical protein